MKIYVDLTDGELRALWACLSHSHRCCQSCCVYSEMQERKTKCKNCLFTKDIDKLIEKLKKAVTKDHDKEVRKQVCDEIRHKLNLIDEYNEFITGMPLTLEEKANNSFNKILNQIEKGDNNND